MTVHARDARGALFRPAVVLLMTAGCADPVVDRKVDALGPEVAGVPVGPLHRPGQPCLLCHDEHGEGRTFSVAGTVFETPEAVAPSVGTIVELIDADGRAFRTATNCAGNFFVEPGAFAPVYPMYVALEHGGLRVEMDSPVFRDGSCASCHGPATNTKSAGPVYLRATGAAEEGVEGCP